MYAWLGGLYGAMLSVMNTFNAQLSGLYGNWGATVMIHVSGLLVLLPFAFTWGRRRGNAPWYLYAGGLIGIATVVFCNLGISGVGVTANLVLMLLGQLVCSTVIDQFGLLGARVVRVNRGKILALFIMAIGCAAMLLLSADNGSAGGVSVALAVALSFLSGFTMVVARISNAKLSAISGVGYSTVMNYVTGLIGSFAVFALMGMKLDTAFPAAGQPLTIYLGGALGAVGIFLCNVITPKLPTLQLSVIIFVGQIFSGMALDGLAGRFSLGTLVGGALVAAGLYVNTRADAREVSAGGDAAKPEKS